MGAAKRYLLDQGEAALHATPNDDPPRLTLRALEKIAMSRSRERILNNLDEMYRESFERAKAGNDASQWPRSTSRIAGNSSTSRSCWTFATRWSVAK